MHRCDYTKRDGRGLWLYSKAPMGPLAPQDVPSFEPVEIATHMRWHPLAQEWVIYAAHRQDRTFLPAADPLAPTRDPQRPTELPAGDYDVAVFENRFPSLAAHPGPAPSMEGVRTAEALGRCEVVVFAQDGALGLAQLADDHVALVLQALADRTRAMAQAGVAYVLPFENRGVEMGVTLHHPHAQIYGYSFLPGQQARALEAQRAHLAAHGRSYMEDLTESEARLGRRMIADFGGAVSFAPPFARFPYETWIAPTRRAARLGDLDDNALLSLARALSDALLRLDGLFAQPMPYLMTIHQAPCGGDCPEWGLRVEIWPIRRTAAKLKYLAGTELGAGVFASDVTPEDAAKLLREAR
ncbi:MAG: galactose-phosphate uridylyltransferase, family 1 [Hyphomicrobiales bacterium]|nr:galactose-phosphate uridylyltransferase, family 1 [Hyphomicrobiales bacterium]